LIVRAYRSGLQRARRHGPRHPHRVSLEQTGYRGKELPVNPLALKAGLLGSNPAGLFKL